MINLIICQYSASHKLPIQRRMLKVQDLNYIFFLKESDNDIALLNQDLAKEDWSDFFRESDTDRAYEFFISRVGLCYYLKNIPLKYRRNHVGKNKHAWITKGIYAVNQNA